MNDIIRMDIRMLLKLILHSLLLLTFLKYYLKQEGEMAYPQGECPGGNVLESTREELSEGGNVQGEMSVHL